MPLSETSRFRVLKKLGEGGMSIVYDAYDRVRGMRVALKTLRNIDAKQLFRFKREFRALSDFSHPNIIALYELASEGGEWLLSMELVDGPDFITYVRNGRNKQVEAGTRTSPDADPATSAISSELEALLSRLDLNEAHRKRTGEGFPDRSGEDGIQSGEELVQRTGDELIIRSHVSELVDTERLRNALGQLANALSVLHLADLIHRDLKPSNVLVTKEHRVVLMDFGVVAELSHSAEIYSERSVVGTPAFMAPEQILGQSPSAAADWYAFGVMMYLAITGRLPFSGPWIEVLHTKQERAPLPVSALVWGVPEDLESLCMELLAKHPEDRPTGAEVLARLGHVPPHTAVAGERLVEPDDNFFVGRAVELAELYDAYDAVCAGSTRCVVLQGLSGMGKTTLVDRFLAELSEERSEEEPLVLAGRCHERESLSYKGFDGVIDTLSLRLAELFRRDRRELLPPDMPLVARLFPVLTRVPECATGEVGDISPLQARERAIAALRTVFSALSKKSPIVVRIEDLQWADRDSLSLLKALLAPPAPERVLVVLTVREENLAGKRTSRLYKLLASLEEQVDCERITLGPLSDSEQEELVRQLKATSHPRAGDDAITALWRQADGHPMLLAELIRALRNLPETAIESLTIEDILWQRILRLPESARIFIELVAVAGEPVPAKVLASAGELSELERERAVARLCSESLARIAHVTLGTGEPWLDAYHEKVRDAITPRLTKARMRALNERLAESLEGRKEAPPALLGRLWAGAERRIQATSHFLEAAAMAAKQLAFDRASELYRRILQLLPERPLNRTQAQLRCRAWLGLAECMRIVDDSGDALIELEHAAAVARTHALVEEEARIHYMAGNLCFPRGDMAGCMRHHESARVFAQQGGSKELEARALSGLGDAYYMQGRVRSAKERYVRCIELCHTHGFIEIAIANMPMRGWTHFFANDLVAALRVSEEAIASAAELNLRRPEIVARTGSIAAALLEMGNLEAAREHLQRALELAEFMGARRFLPMAISGLAQIAALRGERARAEMLAREAVICARRTGFPFVGPWCSGVLARVTENPDVRSRAIAEAMEALDKGAVGHNHLFFYREAIELSLEARDFAAAERYATMLDEYTSPEPLAWSDFYIARGRALIAFGRGIRDAHTIAQLRALNAQAHDQGFRVAEAAIAGAIEVIDAGG